MDKICGVYQIKSKIKPERIYIGSSVNIVARWNTHLNTVRRGYASNLLQNHFNLFGEEDFEFSILEICSENNLLSKEQYYVNKLNPYFNYFKVVERRVPVKQK